MLVQFRCGCEQSWSRCSSEKPRSPLAAERYTTLLLHLHIIQIATLKVKKLNVRLDFVATHQVQYSFNVGGRVLRSAVAPSAMYDLAPPPIHIKSHGKRAFSSYAPVIWNVLPVSVRSSSTLSSFRSALKRHYFQDAFLSQSPRYNW